ncbi:glycosyltransferase family 4 protein [Oxynema sp. CENA135]|uniref:glycosyltransferase family 4 protein n=1 Tax=Oxynema sp. CENA135 TaxID=984206 RepID=UPI00190A63B9|nr:glycosyltransferase family 4 protein [Oxynema sp. CENA135]MBK4730071.1 glycosyltransferase family 4 protein [Oxynema sp. CENA135]
MNDLSLNLLYTIAAYPPSIGGAQLHTHQVASLLARDHRVRVGTHWCENRTDWLLGTTLNAPRDSQQYELDGVEVFQINIPEKQRLPLIPYVLGYYGIKTRAIEKISNTLVPQIEELARDRDLIHNIRMGRENLSYASLKVARKLDLPFIFTPLHHPRWVGWNYKQYINLYRQADRVIALTPTEKQTLIELGVKAERIVITGIGPLVADRADPASFREKYRLSDRPTVLFIGQKYKYKGIRTLLEAGQRLFKKIPELRLVFIGPRTPFSKKLFATIDDPRFIEIGSVSLQEKTDALAACDLLCVPSLQESFGGVYTEAWMMKKPAIGGDIPPIRDTIDEGIDGFVVGADPELLAEKILELLTNPSLRAAMGEAGYRKVLEKFTWEKLSEKLVLTYRELLHGSGA